MDASNSPLERVRTALFVDFDNIQINLAEEDRDAAAAFARNPGRWVEWLARQAPPFYAGTAACRRKIIIRRCYMNPQRFAEFRPDFTRAAFEVIDCPPLTVRGKTSTDIHLVMDVLDALNHPVRIDEFVIFSGDADFTPLLLRLRKHDRLTVVLSAGYVSPAYKAASDAMISTDDFIQHALGIRHPEENTASKTPLTELSAETRALLRGMADRLFEAASSAGGIPGNEIPEIYKRFNEFSKGNDWLGFGSLRLLTEAVVAQREDLAIAEGDPYRVGRRDLKKESASDPEVSKAACLMTTDIADGAPGRDDAFHLKYPAIAPLALKIHTTTGTPYLMPEHYALLFREITRFVRENGYKQYMISKVVRDRCIEQGAPISRANVNFVLHGCINSGHWFDRKGESAEFLADVMLKWVISLCPAAQLKLNEFETQFVREWILGKPDPPAELM